MPFEVSVLAIGVELVDTSTREYRLDYSCFEV